MMRPGDRGGFSGGGGGGYGRGGGGPPARGGGPENMMPQMMQMYQMMMMASQMAQQGVYSPPIRYRSHALSPSVSEALWVARCTPMGYPTYVGLVALR
jgi:hypothetical protein